MEVRKIKVQIGHSGTGKGARINLSFPFLRKYMGIEEYNRDILVCYDNVKGEIIIKKCLFELKKKGHTKPSRLLIAQARSEIKAIKDFEGVNDLYEFYKEGETKAIINTISNKTREMVNIQYYNSCDILGNILDDKDYAKIKEALFNYNFDLVDIGIGCKHLMRYFRDELKYYDRLDKETIKEIVDILVNTLYFEATQGESEDLTLYNIEAIESLKEVFRKESYTLRAGKELIFNGVKYDNIIKYVQDYAFDMVKKDIETELVLKLGYGIIDDYNSTFDIDIFKFSDENYKYLTEKIKRAKPRNIYILNEFYDKVLVNRSLRHKIDHEEYSEIIDFTSCKNAIEQISAYLFTKAFSEIETRYIKGIVYDEDEI